MPDAHQKAPEARPFTQFVQEQRRGALHQELSEHLAETVNAVMEHAKAGQVTIVLKIKPAGDGMVQIFDEVKVRLPEGEKPPSIFFVDERGNVQRQDPRQAELPLRNIERKAAGE